MAVGEPVLSPGFPFSSATVKVFVHATEDEAKLRRAIGVFLPPSVSVATASLTGHFGNPIKVLSARLNKKQTQELWSELTEKLVDMHRLRATLGQRVDSSCILYIRLDKQRACQGELALTESGDAIHIKLKVVARPAKPEVAVRRVLEFLEGSSP